MTLLKFWDELPWEVKLTIIITVGAVLSIVCIIVVCICKWCNKNEKNNYKYEKVNQHESNDRWPAVEKGNTYNFHSYSVSSALNELKEVLKKKTKEAKSRMTDLTLVFITGQGKHSRGGVPKIKPAVIKHLKKEKYRYDVYHFNPGRIEVYIPADSSYYWV